jgi:hypothetical protein
METIIDYLKRSLKAAGARRWEAIAVEVNKTLPARDPPIKLTAHTLRKIAYGDRDNLGLLVTQSLVDYFGAVEKGSIELPPLADEKQAA